MLLQNSLIMLGMLMVAGTIVMLALWRLTGTGIVTKLSLTIIVSVIIACELAFILGQIGLTPLNVLITYPPAILAVLAAMYLMYRITVQPIQNLITAAEKIAGGDLNVEVHQRSNDELGRLAEVIRRVVAYQRNMAEAANNLAVGNLVVEVKPQSDQDVLGNAFAAMIAKLRRMVAQIVQNAQELNLASGQLASTANQAAQATSQISTTIQQVAAGVTHQTDTISNTSSLVEQMGHAITGVARGAQEQSVAVNKASTVTGQINTAIQEVATNANASAQGASHAAQTARSGATTVEETIRGMQAIRERVGVSAQKVQEMGARSDQIGAIVETIDDIAGQTNLLALNAAIEAARAGEHGKGFAVVADEVRKLAERSSAATREIGGLIRNIQTTVAEAVAAMSEGSAEVEKGVARANQAGEALNNILLAVKTVTEQMEKIAREAAHISNSSDTLVNAMDTVSAVVEQNTATAQEMSANSDEVLEAVHDLAGVSQQTSAAVQEVSAGTEEMSAQVEEVTASTQALATLAQSLAAAVAGFKVDGRQDTDGQISVFKQGHINWVNRLNNMFSGELILKENQVDSHTTCVLGSWYYGWGKTEYGEMAEFINLEAPHQQMHRQIAETVKLYNQGNLQAAKNNFNQVKKLSEQIVNGLDALEKKIKTQSQKVGRN